MFSKFLLKYKNSFFFGLLAGLSFPPLYLIIFLLIAFYYLINKLCEINEEKRQYVTAFLYGLIFGFGYFLVQLYWISFSLFVDFKTYFWLFPFAVTFIPLLCAIYIGFVTLLFFYCVKKFKVKNQFLITLIFAFFYTVFEYLRGIVFPWNLFAYILGFSDILSQLVSIVNIYILDFLLVSFFCFGFVLFKYENGRILLIKKNINYSFIYICFFAFLVIFGIYRLYNTKPKDFNLKFRLVQANIPQTLKWDKNEINDNLNRHLNLTTLYGYENVDIVVWAESSMPYIITKDSVLGNRFNSIADKVLITGAIRGEIKDGEFNKIWNSIFFIKNGKVLNFYDKFILVPFGEYVPFVKYIPFIKKMVQSDLEFSKGVGNITMDVNGIKISPLICYEIIFPSNVIDKKNPPDLIINLTNDGWFGMSSGPYQHFVAAKFRAIENKIPIIRVSNSGISAYIDEYGRVKKKLSLGIYGIIDI